MAEKTLEQRSAILDKELRNYSKHGWLIQSRTDTTAQLLLKKKMTFWTGALGYALKHDKTMLLEVDVNGKVRRTEGKA